MSLELPPYFESDIQGKDTALVPFVLIGNNELKQIGTEPHYIWDEFYFLSTNQMTLGVAGHDSSDNEMGNRTSLPILLNIPSLKESIDIEKRNYKISSVNLDISNYEYNGQRFSELISDSSLINTEVRIYWASPSTISFSLSFNPSDADAMQVYFGTIRRYTHDDEKVRLVVEDRSQATLHKDLPIGELNVNDESSPDAGAKIPMVYGHVDRSPLVFKSKHKLLIDTVDVQGVEGSNMGFSESSLWAYIDNYYINVMREDQYTLGRSEFNLNTSNIDMFAETGGTPDPEGTFLKCMDNSKNFNITLSNTRESTTESEDTEYFDIPSGSLMRTIDGENVKNIVNWNGKRVHNFGEYINITYHRSDLVVLYDHLVGSLNIDFRTIVTVLAGNTYIQNAELLLLKLGFDFRPNYDYIDSPALIGLSINGYALTDVLPYNVTASDHGGENAVVLQTDKIDAVNHAGFDFIGGLSDHYFQYHLFIEGLGQDSLFESVLKHWISFDKLSPSSDYDGTGGDNINAAFQFKVDFSTINNGNALVANLNLDGSNVKEIELLREVKVAKFLDYKYYANVNGRVRISPDAPHIIDDLIVELGEKPADLPMEDFIAYEDWKYAFTVDKKINSKKLIEGIASASPYIPRFNNMGEFQLDVIPKTGGTADFQILEADVIDFSFSRTKIEDVYTKIIF